VVVLVQLEHAYIENYSSQVRENAGCEEQPLWIIAKERTVILEMLLNAGSVLRIKRADSLKHLAL